MTAREIEALRLVVVGCSNSEIASCLGISELTAHKHVESARRRLKSEEPRADGRTRGLVRDCAGDAADRLSLKFDHGLFTRRPCSAIVDFSTAGLSNGLYSETIMFDGLSQYPGLTDASLTPISVTIDATVTGDISGVPEPSTWAMMAIGFAGLGFAGYRKARDAPARPSETGGGQPAVGRGWRTAGRGSPPGTR